MIRIDASRFPHPAMARRALEVHRQRVAFDRVVLEHIDQCEPKWPAEILRELREDWGSVCYRSLCRALARLRDRPRPDVVRTPAGYVRARARRRS